MQKRTFKQDLILLVFCFVVSRVIVKILGVSFGFQALYEYWQYLDVTSLSNNLLQSIWYQHSQPPVFNLLLGFIIKCSGSHVQPILEYTWMLISFGNALLLLRILRTIRDKSSLSLFLPLLYMLSPATILFENELFYTTFLSLLLLLVVLYIIKFHYSKNWQNATGIFVSLTLLCLTKSMYHLLWLAAISCILLYAYQRKAGFKKLLTAAVVALIIVGGWYMKNYGIFGSFSASSWTGMNLARVVFRSSEIKDTNTIASIAPFLPISYYRRYISHDYKSKFQGINDRVLLQETKNERFININNAGYLEVTKKYLQACFKQVREHPGDYVKNVCTSLIIFFTPASSYFKVEENSHRIRYYDMIYSFNPAYLFKSEERRKQSLAIAAIPKFLLYCAVFFIVIRKSLQVKYIPVYTIFIIVTIVFTAIGSSLFEYGENMRFRYEIEPLFLVLAARSVALLKGVK